MSAPCVIRGCGGRVHPVQPLAPMEDNPNRRYGWAVCDTCQSKFELWTDPDGQGGNMLVTAGRARGLPADQLEWKEETE